MAGPSPLRESLADRLRATWRGPTSFTAVVPMGTADAGPIGNRLARLDPDFQRVLPEVKDLHSFRLCAVPPGAGAGVGASACPRQLHSRRPARRARVRSHYGRRAAPLAGTCRRRALSAAGQAARLARPVPGPRADPPARSDRADRRRHPRQSPVAGTGRCVRRRPGTSGRVEHGDPGGDHQASDT